MPSKKDPLWESYTRGLHAVRKKAKSPPPKKAPPTQKPSSAPPAPPLYLANKNSFILSTTLERRREKALRQGSLEIDAKLDLHGLTQAEAFTALADFMRRKVKAGKRHLLIVTGKGSTGEGVLRRNLKNWLSHLPEASSILAIREAAPNHGGQGAFYVLLRKKL